VEVNLWELFDAVAGMKSDSPAVRWRARTTTYGEMRRRCVRLANVLTDQGIGWHTDRSQLQPWQSGQDLVATYLLNSPEYLEVSFGGWAARAAPFNVNYRYVADELAQLLGDAAPRAIVYHGRFAEQLSHVLPGLDDEPLLLQVEDDSGESLLPGAVDYETALSGASPELGATGHDPDDLYVVYTGGTTGMPKGTLWRQGDIWTAALGGDFFRDETVAELAELAARNRTPRFLPNAPFMHAAAHWTALRSIFGGGTVVINDVVDRLDPADVWRLVAEERVDMTMMVGEAFARPLLDELESGDHDTSSLTLVVVGGAATSAGTKRRILDALPHVLLVDGAGSSETGGALTSTFRRDTPERGGGFQAGVGVTVLDEELSARVGPGHREPGWFARSGAIPLGYLGDPDRTRATFPVVEGVRYSVPGDWARLRADGTVELLGREAATINSGGEKIFGEEVEAALLSHPAVADVTVVGRPSERWGEEVVAVLSLNAPASDEDLVAAAATRLARYKLPKVIVRVDEVVRNPSGKADYGWARSVAGADVRR
jgi:3-oxocholest-4-en-26-oate---CoA ligase